MLDDGCLMLDKKRIDQEIDKLIDEITFLQEVA